MKIFAKIGLFLFTILFFVSGCTSQDKSKGHYEVENVYISGSDQLVSILTYTSDNGDFYFRILPTAETIDSETDFFNSYPIDWTKIPNPSIE